MKTKDYLTVNSLKNTTNIFLILVFSLFISAWSCGNNDSEDPMEEEMEEEEMGYDYPKGKIFFDFAPLDLDGVSFYEPMGSMGVFPQDHGGFFHYEYGINEPKTPIYAMTDGVVIELGKSGDDFFMIVKYSTTISTKLGHVGRFANFILNQTDPVVEGTPQVVEIEESNLWNLRTI